MIERRDALVGEEEQKDRTMVLAANEIINDDGRQRNNGANLRQPP